MIDTLWPLFITMLRASGQAALLAIFVAALQLMLRRTFSPRWWIVLWSLVILRLTIPILPATRFSAMNLFQSPHQPVLPALREPKFTVTYGIIAGPSQPIPHPQMIPPAKISPTFDWRSFPAIAWAIGAGWIFVRIAFAQILLRHRLRRCDAIHDSRVLKLLQSCRNEIGAPSVRCIQADWIGAPALCGLLHPTLLLPCGLATELSDPELRFILMHELIHARRRDLLADWLIAFAAAVHWFNPAAWIAWRRICTQRELACDAQVLQSTPPADRLHYGQTILNIFERYSASRIEMLSVGVIGQRSSLRRRLLAIAQPPQPWRLQGLIASLCILLILCVAFTSAQPATSITPGSQSATAPSGMVIRSYDVGTLLVNVPDFDDAPEFNLNQSSKPAVAVTKPSRAAPTTQQLAEKLITDIQSRIDPISWKSASISEANGKLIITQTPANQDAIWKYLSSSIGQRSTEIIVETRLLRLTPAIITRWKLLHPKQPLIGDSNFFTKADDDELIQLCESDQRSTLLTAPRLTLFNGQRGYILVATTRAYVRDLHPKPSTTHPSEPDYDPEIGTTQSGVLIDTRATVSADHQYVTLDLKDEEDDLLAMNTVPWPKAPRGRKNLTVQVPTTREQKLSVSVSIPNDGYFAIAAVETIQPAGAVPSGKTPTLVIIHATITSADHPRASILTTRPSDLTKFVMPQP